MKITLTRYGLLAALLFSCLCTFAQTGVPVHQNADKLIFKSEYAYIFKVPEDSVLPYCYRGKTPDPNSKWLQAPVYRLPSNKVDSIWYSKQIPLGHYMVATVRDGIINFYSRNISAFTVRTINMEQERMLIVRDQSGKEVNDAVVSIKGKTIPFNTASKAYVIDPQQGDTVAVRRGNDLQYYITNRYKNQANRYYEQNDYYYENNIYYQNPQYKGYLVTNQPVYKPGDTLRYKAHLLNKAGKPATDTFEVQLSSYQTMRIHKIMPQAPGIYYGEFVLGDTVLPDRPYSLALVHPKKGTAITQQFKVEDYLLDDTYLKVKSEDLPRYQQGDSVILYAFAHNANGLPITDGSIEYWVLQSSFTPEKEVAQVFVADTLYHSKIAANPEGDTRIAFATDIFPDIRNMVFTVQVKLRNTQFEQKDTSFNLYYIPKGNYIELKRQDNKITARLIRNKQSIAGKGYFYNGTGSMLITYPFEGSIKADNQNYRFTEINDSGRVLSFNEIYISNREPVVQEAYIADTAIFKLLNPGEKLLRYTVYKGNEPVMKGIVSRDTLIKIRTAHDETVTFQYSFERNNNYEIFNAVAFKLKSRINIKLDKKDIIYPGQTDTLAVTLSDSARKALPGLNLTVLAFNANFKEDFVPQLSSAGLIALGLDQKKEIIQLAPFAIFNQTSTLTTSWAKNLGLDTAYFYKHIFLNKAPYSSYVYNTKRADIAQLAVYIKKGNTYTLPEYISYDYNVPLYVNKATLSTNPNAVLAFSGRHNIIVRSGKQLFRLNNIDLAQGKKTLLFINSDTLAHRDKKISSVEQMPDTLLQWEKEAIMGRTFQLYNEKGNDYIIRQYGFDFSFNASVYNSRYYSDQYYNDYNDYGYMYNGRNYQTVAPINIANPIQYFQQGNLKIDFTPEAGYVYAIRPGMFRLEKMRPDDYLKGTITDNNRPLKFNEELTLVDWDSLIVNPLPKKQERQRSRSVIFKNQESNPANTPQSRLNLNTTERNPLAGVLFLPHDKTLKPVLIGYSRSLPFTTNLPIGTYDMHIYWDDTTFSSTYNINVKAYGTSAIWISEKSFQKQVPKALIPYVTIHYNNTKGIARHSRQSGDGINPRRVNGWITNEKEQKLKHINIELLQDQQLISTTKSDKKGRFKLENLPADVVFLKFTGKGLKDQMLRIDPRDLGLYGLDFKIIMEPKESVFRETTLEAASAMLETFIDQKTGSVRNYGNVKETDADNLEVMIYGQKVDRRAYTGSSNSVSAIEMSPMRNNSLAYALEDASPGVSASYSNGAPPMPMLSMRGSSSGSSQNLSAETEAVKSNSAFGAAALLNTEGGKDFIADFLSNMQGASGMRRNFRDWAIWQPNLWTDESGKATFAVQYPDNATAWKTYVLTMDKKGISASLFSLTKAFKPLSASLSMPSFLRYGDSAEIIGKVINHTGKAFRLQTNFTSLNIDKTSPETEIQNGKIEQQFIAAPAVNTSKDSSLTASYKLFTEGQYEDGELKTIPVYPVGLVERKGFFAVSMRDTTIHTRAADIDLPFTGNTYISIEGNLLEVMLSEIEQLKVYPHGCTEQLTSKLLSVCYEEKVKQLLGSKAFNNTKEKKEILAKLIAAQNSDGSFGWFGGNNADFRVTNYVLSTLQKLEDKSFGPILYKGLSYLNYNLSRMSTQDLISSLATLSAAAYQSNYEKELERIKEEKLSTYNRFAIIKIKKERNLPYRAALDSIMQEAQTGKSGIKWGDKSYDWYRNELATTLLAYDIIKSDSVYSGKKDNIMMYLLSKRKNGYYDNTAESGLILTTLLPDLIKGNEAQYKERTATSVVLTGSRNDSIKTFPVYLKLNDKNAHLSITKTGISPVYISVAYEYFNQAPEAHKGTFTVHSSFLNQKDQSQLEQGATVTLRVAVESKEDAEYVMIEAPLPAGCVVKNKNKTNAYESSRANFKEKTSIYCGYLPKGTHYFDIELQARYKGTYTLNPASASLMYYAEEQGNNEIKKVRIK